MTTAEPDPKDVNGWGARGDSLRLEGDGAGADHAYARQMRALATDPQLAAAADALSADDGQTAHRLIREVLARRPNDPQALWMFGELAARSGRHHDAETLLARALAGGALAAGPLPPQARGAYALILHELARKAPETLAQTDILLAADPDPPLYRQLRAAALMRTGDFDLSAQAYRQVLDARPDLGAHLDGLWPRAEDPGPPGRGRRGLSGSPASAAGPGRGLGGAWPT